MAFTYTAGATSDRARVRLELGDTDSTRALFSDEELDDILAQEGDSVLGSAARACEILAVRFARDYDFSVDGASFKKGSIYKMYHEMARRLRAKATGSTTVMPTRKDGYSDDVASDTVITGAGSRGLLDFDRGRWDQ